MGVWGFKTCTLSVIIFVVMVGCYDQDHYDVTQDVINEHLSLSLAEGQSAELPGDGVSERKLILRFKTENVDKEHRVVIISSTKGSILEGVQASTGRKLEVNDLEEEITYKSDTQTGIVTISTFLEANPLIVVSQDLYQEQPVPDSVLRFLIIPDVLEADGASSNLIEVRVNRYFPLGTKVKFISTRGKFLPGQSNQQEVTITTDREASVILVSPGETGLVRLSAQVNEFVRATTVQSVIALPDQMIFKTDLDTIPAGANTAIQVEMIRVTGSVTKGSQIIFEGDYGSFANDVILYNGVGKVTNVYSPGDIAYRGAVELTVSIAGSEVRESHIVHISDP